MLGKYCVTSGKIDKAFGKMYRQLFNLRQSGDYEDWVNIEEEDIKPFLEPAENFIAEIEKIIANS
jgi:uncharacterized protein (UPF0332 family)